MSPSSNSICASFPLKIIKKRYESSLPHFIFYVLSIIFLFFFWVITVFWDILCSNTLFLDCWVWLVVFGTNFICFHIVCHIVLIFVLCFGFCWFSYSFDIWFWYFSVLYSVCEFECLSLSEALDCLSYITVFLWCHNMCVLLSWGYFFLNIPFSVSYASLSFALFCLYVVSTVLTYCRFIPVPVLLWSNLSYPSSVLYYAYHAHNRLSQWQLFVNLCYSVFSWAITILVHLSHSILQYCLWFCLALPYLLLMIVWDISSSHFYFYLNLI